jgi:hypothetical protein
LVKGVLLTYLGVDVGELGGRRDVDVNVFDGDALTDEVKIDLNMFGVLMLNGVGGEVDHADVVVDQGGPR